MHWFWWVLIAVGVSSVWLLLLALCKAAGDADEQECEDYLKARDDDNA